MQKSKPLSLRRNFSWTFIGNAVYAACQWGMLVVLAKLGSPEMVGQFTLGLAVTAPIVMFTNLHLDVVQATDANKQYTFGDYLGLRLIGTFIALVVIGMVTLWAGYSLQTSLVILLIALAKAFESISDIFHALIQQHERMDRIAVSLMIKGPLSLLLLGLGVYLSGNIVWGVTGLVIAWALVLVAWDVRNGALMLNQIPLPRWHLKTLKKLVWLSLPLGFVMMLISLNANIPRYFIKEYLGERELGIFAAIAYLMVVGNMVVRSLGESATPKLAKYYADGNSMAFRKLILKLMILGTFLGVTGITVTLVAGRKILTLLYKPEYADYANVFTWLMIGAAILYVEAFLSYGMTAARYFRIQLLLFSLVIVVTSLSCIFFIPSYGLLGAAIALIVGAIARSMGTLAVLLNALYNLQKIQIAKKL